MMNHGFYQSAQFKGRLRKSYEKLSPELRREAIARHRRHLRACEIAGCEPDIMFLFEAIEELAAGRALEAEDVTRREV